MTARQLWLGLRSTSRRHQTPRQTLGNRIRLARSRSQTQRPTQLPHVHQSGWLPGARHPLPPPGISLARCHPLALRPRLAGLLRRSHEDACRATTQHQRRLIPRRRAQSAQLRLEPSGDAEGVRAERVRPGLPSLDAESGLQQVRDAGRGLGVHDHESDWPALPGRLRGEPYQHGPLGWGVFGFPSEKKVSVTSDADESS